MSLGNQYPPTQVIILIRAFRVVPSDICVAAIISGSLNAGEYLCMSFYSSICSLPTANGWEQVVCVLLFIASNA